MRLRSGPVQRVAVATLTFPRVASAANPPLARSNPPGSHHLVLAILGGALLSIGALALLRFRRARRRGRVVQPVEMYSVKY